MTRKITEIEAGEVRWLMALQSVLTARRSDPKYRADGTSHGGDAKGDGGILVTFCAGGMCATYRCPSDRLDELLDAADRRFGIVEATERWIKLKRDFNLPNAATVGTSR
jgi:hypothetical protein